MDTAAGMFQSFVAVGTWCMMLEMLRCLNSNSTTFELRTFSTDLKVDECFKRFVIECEFVEKSLFDD